MYICRKSSSLLTSEVSIKLLFSAMSCMENLASAQLLLLNDFYNIPVNIFNRTKIVETAYGWRCYSSWKSQNESDITILFSYSKRQYTGRARLIRTRLLRSST